MCVYIKAREMNLFPKCVRRTAPNRIRNRKRDFFFIIVLRHRFGFFFTCNSSSVSEK